MSHFTHITCHTSHISHITHITCHTSHISHITQCHITHHISHITRHTSHISHITQCHITQHISHITHSKKERPGDIHLYESYTNRCIYMEIHSYTLCDTWQVLGYGNGVHAYAVVQGMDVHTRRESTTDNIFHRGKNAMPELYAKLTLHPPSYSTGQQASKCKHRYLH